MKIALAHDWFNTKIGGAERVLFELARIYPEAPIYSLIFNHAKFKQYLNPARISTSFLQKTPKVLLNNPRYLLPIIPSAVNSLDFGDADVILSSSFGYIKNLKHKAGQHICYCHTPLRSVWDYKDLYMQEQRVDPIQKLVGSQIAKYVKHWDLAGNRGVDKWLANSKTVAERINSYYHAQADVVYPPVEVDIFKPSRTQPKSNFYLTMSMLSPYKKLDLAITAFNLSGRKLIILGEGAAKKPLAAMAEANVQLLGYVSEAKKRQLLQNARALIYPNEEDFGIAPVEAMAAGTPVVAFGRGGATETIINHKTGILFDKQTPQALNRAIEELEGQHFYQADLLKRAEQFSAQHFDKAIKKVVQDVYANRI